MIEPRPGEPPLKLLHLTDPHLFADVGGELRGRVTYDCLSRVIAHCRHSGWPAELVLLTGDVAQDDSRSAYEHCGRLLATLDLPVFCLPGNHDVPELMREVLERFAFRYCASTETRGWLVTCIDSCRPGTAAGRIAETELSRLETILRESSASHALIALHHPPVSVGTRWLDDVGLSNGSEFLRVASGGERASVVCLCGHIHQAFDTHRGDVRILGTPSTCRQFRVGSETFAVDDRPPAYRRLTLHADGRLDTEVIWIP